MHRKRQMEERLRAGPLWGDTWGLAFTTEIGEPVSGTALTHRFQATLKAAGLPRLRFHDLRRSAASFACSGDTAPEILGHSQIAITANTYTHVAGSWDATPLSGWVRFCGHSLERVAVNALRNLARALQMVHNYI